MSAYVLTDFEINLLVHLAVHGPREAEDWRHLTDEPAEIGAQLAARNAEAAGRPGDGPRDYAFAPLNLDVSAVEGLKQIGHYIYQTADPEDRWRADGVGRFLDTLRAALITALPGWAEAPWGWSRQDALSHEAAPKEGDPPIDSRVQDLLDRFERAGAVLVPFTGATVEAVDPRSVLGQWLFPKHYLGMPPLRVVLLSDEDIAAHHYLRLRSDLDRINPLIHSGILRFGATVVRLEWSPLVPQPPEGIGHEDLWALVERLGEPDERWTSLETPLFTGRGEVTARRVRTPFTSHLDIGAVVAYDRPSLARLAETILDDDARVVVEAVDPRSQMVLLVHGIPELGDVTGVAMRQTVALSTWEPGKSEFKVELSVEPPTGGIASVVVVDRPPHVPTMLELRDPTSRPMGLIVRRPRSDSGDDSGG